MSTELSITKSMLAKLLAGENINVVHKKVSTAAFDLKTRTLYLPIWEDMTGELYDLLGGHEVGHALYTPQEGWHTETHDADGNFLGSFKDVLNVCEDSRIEKLIRRKYPGLAKSFVAGYKILYGRDFFGIKRLKDFSKLNLIDRINIHSKCGTFLIVPFNDEERDIIRTVESAETWEQTVEIAKVIFERVKKEEDSKINNLEDLTEQLLREFADDSQDMDMELDISGSDDSEKSEEDGEDTSYENFGDDSDEDSTEDGASESSDEQEESEEDKSTGDSGEDSDEESDEESNTAVSGDSDDDSEDSDEASEDKNSESETSSGDTDSDGDSDDPQSVTDRKFRERERELVVEGIEVYTYNLPKPMLDRIIIPNKAYTDNFFEVMRASESATPIGKTCVRRFNENNGRYINLLVKEFEMRKNASQYARTVVAKTGELDMNKLHQYKFTNDLFKKTSIVQKGKSHGMIMYVDMSGSMGECFGATMEQTLILVAFCRKIGIPFDVYGFGNSRENLRQLIAAKKISTSFLSSKFQKMGGDEYTIKDESYHLIHFISSDLRGSNYNRAFEMMAIIAMNWRNKMYPRCYLNWAGMAVSLGSTPFTQTLMASRMMIDQFKAAHKVDITNVIYLTDGDGTTCFTFTGIKSTPYDPKKPRVSNHIYLVDYKTKRRVSFRLNGSYVDEAAQQSAITQFVRELTGCKHIGFYIDERHDIREKMNEYKTKLSLNEQKVFEKGWRENHYVSFPNIGYDTYYYVLMGTANVKDEDYSISDAMTNRRIAKVFSDAQQNKHRNRVLVSKFAQEIAA